MNYQRILYTDTKRSKPVHDPQNGQQSNPVLATATLAEQVYDHLRQGILANDYPPGTSLPEETVAARFSVSRVPVREALRRLAADGLVTLTPRQGATVSSLSPKQFLDAYRVREALETLAIRLAIPESHRSGHRHDLQRLNQHMRPACRSRRRHASIFYRQRRISRFHRHPGR